MAQQEPEYAQNFYDYLVEEDAPEEKNEKTERIIGGEIPSCEHVEECIASEGDGRKENVKQGDHDQHQQEYDEKHELTFVENNYDKHERHEFDYMWFDCDLKCKNDKGNSDDMGKVILHSTSLEENDRMCNKVQDGCEQKVKKKEVSCIIEDEINTTIYLSKRDSNLTSSSNKRSV
jgi:hypothetical protein